MLAVPVALALVSPTAAMIFESISPILSVDDLPRALDEYVRVFGFEQAWVWGDPPVIAGLCRGRVEINLTQRGKLGPPGPGQAYLRAEPIDEVWNELTSRGAAVQVPIEDRAYGMRDFSLRDASGNRLDFGAPIRESEPPAAGTPSADVMKVFVPAKDFALAKRFYAAIGFRQNWEAGDLAEIELGGTKLLLQNHWQKDWAGNFMIHIEVADADAWARHLSAVLAGNSFPGAHIAGPKLEDWGYKVTYLIDPSGVCLHFAQPLARPSGG